MIDRRAVLAGATTFAGAVALADTAAAQRSNRKRSFMVHMVVNVEFVGGGDGPVLSEDNVRKHLEEELRKTIERFSVRTVSDTRLGEIKVADIKN